MLESFLIGWLVSAIIVFILSRKTVKKAWIGGAIITGIYALTSVLICWHFNDWELIWLIANFAICLPMFWGLIIKLNDGARDWNAIIDNGGYVFVAYVSYRTKTPVMQTTVRIFGTSMYKYIFKYRDCDGLTKSGSVDLRQGWGSNTIKRMIIIHQLGKPQVRRILYEYASDKMCDKYNKGIFVRPGIDPRRSAIKDDEELREKYTSQNLEKI